MNVRLFDKKQMRYLVDFSGFELLDDCVIAVVERMPGLFDRPYYYCYRHKDMSCDCVNAVLDYIEDLGLDPSKE